MTTTILNKDCRTRTAKAARAASLLFAAGSILIGTINAQVGTTDVYLDSSADWKGWMVVGTNELSTAYPIGDLAAGFIGNVLAFAPNTSISRDFPATNRYWWKPDGTGAKKMDAVLYVNDDTLAGSNVTFSGWCLTNTLALPYKTNITAFIKEFNTNNWALITNVSKRITNGLKFTISRTTARTNHVEYGFEMVGTNASLSNTNLGWVVFSKDNSASAPPFPVPPQIVETSWKTAATTNAVVGSNLVLKATVVRGIGLTYQWQKDGVNLVNSSSVDGATDSMLTLTGIQVGDGGTYTVVLSDEMGRTDNRLVYLIVLDPKDLPIDPRANWLSRVQRSTDGGKTYPTNQEYLPASDLKAVFTNGALSLAPNTKEYTNSFPGTNSDGSSKEYLSADYYVEYACLSGNELTFAGYCPSNSLTSGYNSQAWIKEFTPGYTNLVGVQTTNLAAGQKFEVKLTSTASTNLIQYGFSTLGLVANPKNASSLGKALISLLPPWKVTNVTVNPSTNWQGWMIVRALPASGQAYDGGANVFGTNWDTEYLDASFLPTNVLVFTPSSEISGNSPISATDPSWWNVDGNGARQMDAIYYVNDDSMAGKQVTFSGYCLTNTLEVPYRTNITAFIKEFNADFSETISITTTQMTKGFFSLTLPPTNANHVQYGFEMVGPNAKSSNLANLGWVVISSNANAVVPPVVQSANITGTSWGSASNIDTTIGDSNIMVVSVSGSGLTYQWQRNGVDLPEQTSATLNLGSVKSGDEGTYTLVVTDAIGRPSTRSVYLNVLNPSDLPIDPNAKWFSRVARSTDGGVTYWINQEYTPASDLKAVFTNGVLSLAPNTKEYTNSSPGTNSDGSSKEFLKADYYVEYACLSGKELTFAGYCPSNSLTSGYNSQAWIKEFTPGYTNLVGEQTTNLAAGQKFEVKLTSTASTNLIQYGFSTLGLVANPVNASSLGEALIALLPPWKMTNVTVDPSADWQGWMIARELPTVGQAYTEGTNLFSTSWAQNADLDARFLLTNVLVFTPNTVIEEQSPISANDPSWWNADGTGARQMDAIFYVSDDSLAGKKVTFSGYCLTNTLADPYSTNITAFIREFDADYSNIVAVTTTQMTRGYFSLVLQTAISTDSNHVQYGFEMVGPNASLENITNLGWVVISSNANAVVPPRAGPAKITATTWLGANIYTTVGTEITLEATASGRGLTYEWSKDGKILSTAGLKLYLSNVSGSDEGVYKLVVTDDMGNWSASSTYLVVFDPSHLTIEPNASWLSRVTRLTNSGIGADWIFKTNVEYALASDLRAGFTNGALKLAPNTKEYTNSSPGTNSDGSSREFLKAEYYIEYDRLAGNTQTYGSLAGKALTFAGYCPSNSLATGYTVYAFIKEAYHDYRATTNSQETKLVAGQAFILTLSSTSSTNLIQYGFRTEGQVANPLTASTLGQAFVYPLIVPSLTITRSLNNHNTIEINCPSMAGVDYIVEYKTDLSQTNWQTLGNWSDQVGMFTVLDNSIIKTAQQRYYRLSIKFSK